MNNSFKYSFNWASSQNVKQQHAKCNLVPALELYKLIKLLTQWLRRNFTEEKIHYGVSLNPIMILKS